MGHDHAAVSKELSEMPRSRRFSGSRHPVQCFALALAMGAVACEPTLPPPPTADAHLADVEAWREWRYADLDQPDNWLALTGLFWLREGENTFGAAEDNDLVFPGEGVPARLCVLSVADDERTWASWRTETSYERSAWARTLMETPSCWSWDRSGGM